MSSKKILIAVIVLVVLLGGAIAGYIAVDRSKTREENTSQAEADSMQLFNFNVDSIDTVSIDNEDGHFLITSENGPWELKETDYPNDVNLNPYYITAVVTYMCDLQAVQKVEADPGKLASYGLDKPVVITCSSGSTSYTLHVGNASVTEEYWYVMLPEDSFIYAVDYSEGETLRGGMTFLKNRSMLESSDVAINAFCLQKDGEPVVDLEKKDGLWEMHAPLKDANVNSAQVSLMLTSLTRKEYSGFETVAEKPADLAAYGLDKPAYTLTIKSGDLTEELLFAPQNKTGGGMYVLNKASGQIAAMDAGTAGFLELKPEELLMDTLISLPYADARSLEVHVDDLSFTMEMDAQAGTCSLDGRDLSGMDDNIRTLHRNLYDTVANLTWEELRLDAELPEQLVEATETSTEAPAEASTEEATESEEAPQAGSSECRFVFTDAGGNVTELVLYPTEDENIYLAAINGENTHMTVRRRSLTGNTGVLNFYEKLTDAIG